MGDKRTPVFRGTPAAIHDAEKLLADVREHSLSERGMLLRLGSEIIASPPILSQELFSRPIDDSDGAESARELIPEMRARPRLAPGRHV